MSPEEEKIQKGIADALRRSAVHWPESPIDENKKAFFLFREPDPAVPRVSSCYREHGGEIRAGQRPPSRPGLQTVYYEESLGRLKSNGPV